MAGINNLAGVGDLFAKCTPAYGLGNLKCGSITEMDLSATNASELDAIYADANGKLRIMGALIEADFMGKACQIRQNSLYDFMMATSRSWGTQRVGMQPLSRDLVEVNPFVRMHRRGFIQDNFWTVSSGSGSGGTSPNQASGSNVGGVAYTYSCQVTSQTGIPADFRWFPVRQVIFINSMTGGGSVTRTSYKVVDANISGGVFTLYCTSLNAGSNLSSAKLTTPVSGFLTRGVMNVNPYESFGAQIPGVNPNQLALFWIQDTRYTICLDEQTERYLQLLRENNPLFREFGDVEEVELNRQIIEDFQRREIESFFWNKPLPNQDPVNYGSLETIQALDGTNVSAYFYLPNLAGRNIARRANAVGMYEQLAECGRVFDGQNSVFNLTGFLNELYRIHRARHDNGIPDKLIEVWTDMAFAQQLRRAFWLYLNNETGGNMRVTLPLEQVIKGGKTTTGFSYHDIELVYPAGVTLRICTHLAFDDLFAAQKAADVTNSTSYANASRYLLVLDMGRTMYKAVIESQAVNLQSGDLKTLAAVSEDVLNRMAVLRKKVRHIGQKYTYVLECPLASMWVEGIAPTVPEWRGLANSGNMFGTLAGYTG